MDEDDGSLAQQAQELDANGYSSYLLLANLLKDENRYAVYLGALGRDERRSEASDELLFTVFFVVVLNVFCAFWRKRTDVSELYKLPHPPPPVRINKVIRVAQMYAGQNGPVADTWFQPSRFRELFRIAAAAIPGSEADQQTWDGQMALLRSPEGERYSRELFYPHAELAHSELSRPFGPIPRAHLHSFLRVTRDPLRAAATPSSQSSNRPHTSGVLPERSGDATQRDGQQEFLFAGTRYDRREAVNSGRSISGRRKPEIDHWFTSPLNGIKIYSRKPNCIRRSPFPCVASLKTSGTQQLSSAGPRP